MAVITNVLPACDPVTFAGPDDREGLVHRYQDRDARATACGIVLAGDHMVAGPASTKPLCEGCWA